MAFISVVIPVYNKALYVERAIKSVVAQTHTHWELIVVDDGSTDTSLEIASLHASDRVRIVSQRNAGVGAARNTGASFAKSDHICFLDADDEWHQRHLTDISELIDLDSKAGIYTKRFAEEHPDGTLALPYLALPDDFKGSIPDFFTEIARSRSLIQTSSCCLRKSALCEVGGFPVGETSGEDVFVWLEIARRHDVLFDARPTCTYRTSVPGSLGEGNDDRHPYPLKRYLKERNLPDDEPRLHRLIMRLALTHCVAASARNRGNLSWDVAKWVAHYDRMKAIECALVACTPPSAILAAWRARNLFRDFWSRLSRLQ